ncbi:heat shock 70 kDa protein 12A-like [Saccostrea echinata]|uniref:heat shock 70 kDa protein 12A-like n=1 Tax=Saccostrea echinata TaxID=191078 RepID=UPI002A7F8EBE|nr:heat shock 70 kDa protein 12A-like [Saccostrea echinata]XP_061183642.1 heat shock 70 kDa protein 12A-like [Saccostrea echinata]
MACAQEDRLMTAAIDFGTTYSGYCFSFRHDFETDPLKVSANTWTAGTAGLVSLKTPTTVLLDGDGELVAFGYEAEDRYSELADEQEHADYYYFRRFKMTLFNSSSRLTRDTMLKDMTGGKQMKAITVFAHAIRYLKDHMLKTLDQRGAGIKARDINWVLTVPAIWDDPSKQFMREAAEEAGINRVQLMIALEPEAASLFCKYLPIEKLQGAEGGISAFKPGSRYLVLDAGGGTVDITVHEVQFNGTLKELDKASGGAWGGTRVDQSFKEMLEEIVGGGMLEEFALSHTADYIDLFRDFETKKRNVKDDAPGKITIRIPISLQELYEERSGEEIKKKIRQTKYKDDLTWVGDRLRINKPCFVNLFSAASDGMVNHVKQLLRSPRVRGTNNILMVGGFSESPLLQKRIREEFPDSRVIIPQEAGLAVLKGAVIFGHQPATIAARIAKYTYGIETNTTFDRRKHPESKKKMVEGREKCKDVFDKHVCTGQLLEIDDVQSEKSYWPLYSNQTKVSLPVYTSTREDPEFVDESGSSYLGKLTVDLPKYGSDKEVSTSFIFGGTELKVQAVVKSTGEVTSANFDFLEGEP